VPPSYEDSIEVVTILKSPANLTLNNKTIIVEQGVVSTKFNQAPGKVEVTVSRNGKSIIDLTTPEWITATPFRTDRIIYCFSSEFYNFYKDIFGDLPPEYSTEYAKDKRNPTTLYVRKNQ
jgi:hypothetical protein